MTAAVVSSENAPPGPYFATSQLKKVRGLAPADPEREEQQIARLRDLAVRAQLNPEFAEKWLEFVVAEVVRHHEAIAEDHARGA